MYRLFGRYEIGASANLTIRSRVAGDYQVERSEVEKNEHVSTRLGVPVVRGLLRGRGDDRNGASYGELVRSGTRQRAHEQDGQLGARRLVQRGSTPRLRLGYSRRALQW